MTDLAIRVDGLSKRYRLGQRERYKTLHDALTRVGSLPLRAAKRVLRGQSPLPSRRNDDTLWVLKNVSFEIKRGEVLGIMDRNGSRKSTLLKVLSRITEPTEGYAEIRERVGPCLR